MRGNSRKRDGCVFLQIRAMTNFGVEGIQQKQKRSRKAEAQQHAHEVVQKTVGTCWRLIAVHSRVNDLGVWKVRRLQNSSFSTLFEQQLILTPAEFVFSFDADKLLLSGGEFADFGLGGLQSVIHIVQDQIA